MKFLVVTTLILFFSTGFSAANAGDKVGNGGGLWACITPNQFVLQGTLVDLYEARTEFGLLTITSLESNPLNIVKERENYLRSFNSSFATAWSVALADVLQKMRLVDAELEKVDDSLFRMRPLPATCNGTWNYVQFANFTHLNQVLVRKDMWNNPAVPSLDKAALIWHEAIYKWLRETYGDKDSVRTRQIVGLLFAQITPAELEQGIAAVLKQTEPNPQPTPTPTPKPTQMSVCIISNSMSSMWYMGYGNNAAAAERSAIQICESAPEGFHCARHNTRWDSFQTDAENKYDATVTNSLIHKTYGGEGRSKIEAEGKARIACANYAGPHAAIHCSEPTFN